MEEGNNDSGLWSRVKEEMKEKITKESVFRFAVPIITICVLWEVLSPHINKWLVSWNNHWLRPLDETGVIVAIYLLLAIFITTYIYAHIKKKAHLSYTSWSILIQLVIMYSYYRFYDRTFYFWGNDYVAWTDILYIVIAVLAACDIRYGVWKISYAQKVQRVQESAFDDDNAIKIAKQDSFRYMSIVDDLCELLKNINLSEHAYSIGISGEWGIGKSSLLNLFVNKVKETDIVVQYFPRNAKKVELIQEEFFATFTEELRKYSYNASYVVGKYAYALNLYSSTRWIYNIIDWFSHWTSESEKEQINKMIRSTEKRVYVIIEDLDRLTGPEILEVLKLIERNGNFCNTIFLTAYDKRYVNDVLRKALGYSDMTVDFTDKYFQYELPLFKQEEEEIKNYLYERIYHWAISNYPDEMGEKRPENEWQMISRLIVPLVPTLRHAKRLSNLFKFAYIHEKTYSKVNLSDFIVVTLIRYLDMETYHNLYNQMYVTYAEKVVSDHKQLVLSKEYQELSLQSKIPRLASLLEFLFDGHVGYRQFESTYHRIDRTEFFKNYFYSEIRGKLYYGDMNIAMNMSSLAESLALFDQYIEEKNGAEESITEFLCTRDAKRIGTVARLHRYVCLLIYANYKISNLELNIAMTRMMHGDTQLSYASIMTGRQYREVVMSAFENMMKYAAYPVGLFFRNRLAERLPMGKKEDKWIDSTYQDALYIIKAQKNYNAQYGTEAWEARESIMLASFIPGENKRYYNQRCKEAAEMLKKHPDAYAKGLLMVSRSGRSRIRTSVALFGHLYLTSVLYEYGGYEGWVERIKDKSLKYIYTRLHEIAMEENEAHCTLSANIQRDDYRAIAAAMKIEKKGDRSASA